MDTDGGLLQSQKGAKKGTSKEGGAAGEGYQAKQAIKSILNPEKDRLLVHQVCTLTHIRAARRECNH